MGRISTIALAMALICSLHLATALDPEESAFITLINDYRASYGLGSLSLSPTLTVAAELHSQDMAVNDYFSHYSLDGRSPLDRVIEAGYDYPTTVGENIAAGYTTAASVFEGWRNSPGHNQTMLHPSFLVIGIGRYYDASSYYGWYWTTDFGGYDDSGELPPPPPPPPPPPVQVSSPTHPSQTTWYSDSDPQFDWVPVTGAEGYSYCIDHTSTTNPDTIIDTTSTGMDYTGLSDGIWYFHVRVKTAGGWGQASHLKLMIDTTSPSSPAVSSPTHPVQGSEYPDDDPALGWSVDPDPSGITGYSFTIDHEAGTIPDTVIDSQDQGHAYHGLEEGTWYFHLRARDGAGNWGPASHFTLVIRFVPVADFQATPSSGYEPLFVSFTDLSASHSGITSWLWEFGDGETSNQANPVHIYPEEGNYSVTLTVWEGDGDSDHESKLEYIWVIQPVPGEDIISLLPAGYPVVGSTVAGIYPDADGYVDPAFPSVFFGHENSLVVDELGSITYLKFDLSSIPQVANVLDARVGLLVASADDLDGLQVEVHPCDDSNWNEADLSWCQRPEIGPVPCASGIFTGINQSYVIFDIADPLQLLLPTGNLTLAFKTISGTGGLNFSSRETQDRPVLVVRYALQDVHTISLSSYEGMGIIPNSGEIVIDDHTASLPSSVNIVAGTYPVGYIPGYEFDGWEIHGQVNIQDLGEINSTVTITGPGSITARGSLDSISIAYDDGTCEYSSGRSRGEMAGVLFRPSYTGDLSGVEIFIDRLYGSANNTAAIHVMDSTGHDVIPPVLFTPSQEGWVSICIEDDVPVKGDFIVCLEYLNDHYPRLGVDDSGSGPSFTVSDQGRYDYHSNFMVRSRIQLDQPPKQIIRLTTRIDPGSPQTGEPFEIAGTLNPSLQGVDLQVQVVSPDGIGVNYDITSNSSGSYSLTHTPFTAGNWLVTTQLQPVPGYEFQFDQQTVQVQRGQIELDCRVDPLTSFFGDPVRIFGTVGPVVTPVNIEMKHNGGDWELLQLVEPLDNLTYSHAWLPHSAGEFQIRARSESGEDFEGVLTFPEYLLVLQLDTDMDIEIPGTLTTYGKNLTVTGSITPPLPVPLRIERWNGSSWETLADLESGTNGSFICIWSVDLTGNFLIRASWEGDGNYRGSFSDAVILHSERAPSSISISARPVQADANEPVNLSGRVSPPLEVTVTIIVDQPGGERAQLVSMTNVTGDYNACLNPVMIGEWRITASWDGNNQFLGCDSGEVAVNVGIDESWLNIAPILLSFFYLRFLIRMKAENSP